MGSLLVLLTDDDDDIRAVGGMALEAVGGFRVLPADSGERCLALAREQAPDVILLDVMMPGMDGLETLGRLRDDASTAEIPVVFMTARVQAEELSAYRAEGARGVIAKPFDPMTLSGDLKRLLAEPEPGAMW